MIWRRGTSCQAASRELPASICGQRASLGEPGRRAAPAGTPGSRRPCHPCRHQRGQLAAGALQGLLQPRALGGRIDLLAQDDAGTVALAFVCARTASPAAAAPAARSPGPARPDGRAGRAQPWVSSKSRSTRARSSASAASAPSPSRLQLDHGAGAELQPHHLDHALRVDPVAVGCAAQPDLGREALGELGELDRRPRVQARSGG